MMYSDVEAFVSAGLIARGYGTPDNPPMPLIDPGPGEDERLQRRSPAAIVFLTAGDGQGFTTEQVFEMMFIRERVLSRQGDFAGGEKLARDVDNILCSVSGNAIVGTAQALYITRAGGPPALLTRDVSDRYHFTCTHITETASGL